MLARWAGGGMVIYADKVGWREWGNICWQGGLEGEWEYMLARWAGGGVVIYADKVGWRGSGDLCRQGGLEGKW